MTLVAAANPHAWDPTARPAHELVDVGPGNRMIATPYPKRTIAQMDVDMSAALVIASMEAADHLGVPEERRVHLRGWAEADDAHYVAEHPDLWRSPAMEWCARHALAGAGAIPDDLAHLDLYSCFASSIDFARDALGLAPGDDRSVTVTGGLPYAGGPASNYLSHAVASMVERLRDDPGSVGLVSGVGMHLTKHVYAAYSTTPGPIAPADDADAQAELDVANPPRSIVDTWTGPAGLAAYSVVHGRDGAAQWGLGVCELDDGSRAYARTEDPGVLAAWEAEEWVGRPVRLEADGQVNRLFV
jgi:acetyl-CoA C-acetyltransferase